MDEQDVKNLTRVMEEEALSEFESVGGMELGSEAHVKTVNAANNMVDRLNEAKKIENEARKLDIEEKKLEMEQKKHEDDKKSQKVGWGITIGTTLLYVATWLYGFKDSQKFEKEGFNDSTEGGRTSKRKVLSFLDKVKP